jgi:hypothetical protein
MKENTFTVIAGSFYTLLSISLFAGLMMNESSLPIMSLAGIFIISIGAFGIHLIVKGIKSTNNPTTTNRPT